MRNSLLKINTRVASSFVHWSLRVLFTRSTILHFYKHRLTAVPFILMLMIRWTAFSVSFRHFSRCCTLPCLSCRPETRDEKLHSDGNCRLNSMKKDSTNVGLFHWDKRTTYTSLSEIHPICQTNKFLTHLRPLDRETRFQIQSYRQGKPILGCEIKISRHFKGLKPREGRGLLLRLS